MPTQAQVDELQQSLLKFHNHHHGNWGLSLEYCTDPKCVDAKLAIAWLREQLSKQQTSDQRTGTQG